MSGTINGTRQSLIDKLTANATDLTTPATYAAADISASYVEAEVQAIADQLATTNTALRNLYAALLTAGVIK